MQRNGRALYNLVAKSADLLDELSDPLGSEGVCRRLRGCDERRGHWLPSQRLPE